MGVSNKYYPSLGSLLKVGNIPKQLAFVNVAIEKLTQELFYRDYVHEKSLQGGKQFYSLKLVSFKRIGLEMEGLQGLGLYLNPSGVKETEIPLQLTTEWEILKYTSGISISNFNEVSPSTIFSILSKILNFDDKGIIMRVFRSEIIPNAKEELFIFYNTNYSGHVRLFNEFSNEEAALRWRDAVVTDDNDVYEVLAGYLISKILVTAPQFKYLKILVTAPQFKYFSIFRKNILCQE